MKKMKPATVAILVLVGTVAAALIYLGATLALTAAMGGQAVASKKDPGPASVYDEPEPIDDFNLADQTGARYRFSSSKGKVVVMTFLFTHCGDVCPYSAIKMKLALDNLGDQAKNVELVVVDTDPERDTVAVLADYSKSLGLYDKWHMVTGSPGEMLQVYKNLGITVVKTDGEDVMETAKPDPDSPLFGLTDAQILAGSDVAKRFAGGYQIAHSAPFWIIDAKGDLRVSLDVSASPEQIAATVKNYLP
ncbi:MAG: SCO family protein [Spirochaetales bacterium]